jgi:hypothetical protein
MKVHSVASNPNGDRRKTKKTTIGHSTNSKRRKGIKNRQMKSSAYYRGQG